MSTETATVTPPQQDSAAIPVAVLDKLKAASEIVQKALKVVLANAKEGKNVLQLAGEGDQAIEEAATKIYNKGGEAGKIQKGIAFPTSISVNSTVCNYSPLPSDPTGSTLTLKKDDVVKIVCGAHIDGYASLAGETIVVGASESSPVTGIRADLISAAYNAAEAALRSVKIGQPNWSVTDGVAKVLQEYGGAVKGVEGMVSHQMEQNQIDAKKRILLFPALEQRRDSDNQFKLEEGEVYALDVCVTNGDGKTKLDQGQTTIFQKTSSTYLLKLKASRSTFSEISKKAGSFPFTLRSLDDEKKAKMGVQECVQHGLLKPYEIHVTEKPGDLVAQFILTFAITKNGIVRISQPPVAYNPAILKPDHEIKDEEVKALLTKPLKPPKKKNKKKVGEKEDGKEDEE